MTPSSSRQAAPAQRQGGYGQGDGAALAVTGMGMITSVGRDTATACASIRAGITRPQEIPSFPLLDEDTCEELALVGHPIESFSEGFAALGVWLRLGLACLDQLAEAPDLPGPEDAKFWGRTGLLVVTPALLAERFGPEAADPTGLERSYLDRLIGQSRRPFARDFSAVVPAGHTGAIAALIEARKLLASRELDRVIILGADSFLDDLTLDHLAEANRLKTPANPAGFAPGEAAACLLLEDLSAATRRGATVRALVSAARLADEERTLASGLLSRGEALARALDGCLADDGEVGLFADDLVADLNGEAWRAQELATALVRVRRSWGAPRSVYPAASVGETGAASGPLSLCVGVRAIERGYSRGSRVLVTTSSEDGQVGAALLSRG